MKRSVLLIVTGLILILWACSKETESDRFRALTSHIWTSDSLLAEGLDVSGPGQLLEKFKGDAQFNKDGTGTFGMYKGTWKFSYKETNLVIDSDSLPVALTANIILLTDANLKITTAYPNKLDASNPLDIRMTFKPK